MKKSIYMFLFVISVLSFVCFSDTAESTPVLMENIREITVPRFENWDNDPVLTAINKKLYEKAYIQFESWSNLADEEYVQPMDERFDLASFYSEYEIAYQKGDIYSFIFTEYVYPYMAAHGSSLMAGYTFDLKTGREYQLEDLFKENSGWKQFINDYIKNEIKEKDILLFEDTPFESIDENQEFYLKPDSLVIFYQQYAYTCYAYGFLIFEITYEQLKDYLKIDL